jgi:hypothetical protein
LRLNFIELSSAIDLQGESFLPTTGGRKIYGVLHLLRMTIGEDSELLRGSDVDREGLLVESDVDV